MGKARYAIYYTPDSDSPLWEFCTRWLGRDCATGKDIAQPNVKDMDGKWLRDITVAPRHYGLHATLKPPFRLAKGHDRETLDEALEAFVTGHPSIKVPGLELAALDGFIALRPKKSCQDLQDFAASCVKEFDGFRAPPSDQELKKRLKGDLTKPQKDLLHKWGYPYVLDEFRFHMTLTERLKDKDRKVAFKALNKLMGDLLDGKPWVLDTLTLARQKNPDQPFLILKTYPFMQRRVGRWLAKKK